MNLFKKYNISKKVFLIVGFSIATTSTAFAMTSIYATTNIKKAKIVWAGQNVKNCTASGGYGAIWSGSKATSGEFTIPDLSMPNPGIYSFSITCEDDDTVNTFTASTDIESLATEVKLSASQSGSSPQNPYLTLNFNARYTDLPYGYTNLLSWNFSDPNGSCTASGDWTGSKTPVSNFSYANINSSGALQSKTYNLRCTATNGEVKTASIPVTERYYVANGGGGVRGGGGGCFTQGTMVAMANGEKKDIALVKPGEYILSSYGPEQVKKKYEIDYAGDLYAFNGSENYFVTPTHPFMTTEGWKSFDPEGSKKETPGLEVTKLSTGDTLVMKDGTLQKLERIDTKKGHTTVYNFGVNGSHDFYADNYQVHNVNLGVFIPKVEAAANRLK